MEIRPCCSCGLTVIRADGTKYDSTKILSLTRNTVQRVCPTKNPSYVCQESPNADLGELARRVGESEILKCNHDNWLLRFSFFCSLSFYLISSAPIRASNRFLIDLYQALDGSSGSSDEGNIILSPFSIFTGLSLLQLGTAGDTRDSFQSALHFPVGKYKRVHQDARKFIKYMEKKSYPTFILQTSNAVFLDDNFSITENYRFAIRVLP